MKKSREVCYNVIIFAALYRNLHPSGFSMHYEKDILSQITNIKVKSVMRIHFIPLRTMDIYAYFTVTVNPKLVKNVM